MSKKKNYKGSMRGFIVKEFSFQVNDKDFGIQCIDLGDKEFYHVHLSYFTDHGEEIICGDMRRDSLDELYDNLEALANTIFMFINNYEEDKN